MRPHSTRSVPDARLQNLDCPSGETCPVWGSETRAWAVIGTLALLRGFVGLPSLPLVRKQAGHGVVELTHPSVLTTER